MTLEVSDVRSFVPARDFELCRNFYTALGWTQLWGDAKLALLELADQRFYLQNYFVREWAENCMLHLSVSDSRSCYRQVSELLDSGRFPAARVASPTPEDYGALVTYVWDPSGVRLHLAQWD